jgi:signal transduction histidine kinase
VHEAVQVVRVLSAVSFGLLALAAVRQWRVRRATAAAWAAAAFTAIGIVAVVGIIEPQRPHEVGLKILGRVLIACLVVFPYFVFRFTLAFRRPSPALFRLVTALTSALVIWTFALSHLPAQGEKWPVDFAVYVVFFYVHWVVLSIASARQLWLAGRHQPSVARRRMRLLAVAGILLTLALLLTTSAGSDSVRALVTQVLAIASAVLFGIGLSPPQLLRISWRRPEQERLQETIQSLMTLATTQEEIAERVLRPAAEIVGARAIRVLNENARTVGLWGVVDPDVDPLALTFPGGTLLVWTTPYAPFFGEEELALLRTLGALTGLALDRVRLFEHEHTARLELERANQVKTNFVALAAHELRTPVTTIHGFVQTLHHLGDRIDDAQRRELRASLEQQTARMALLVEQLLDLSRLDAEAVEIVPQRIHVRERVEEIVGTAAANRRGAVRVDVPDGLEANVDPAAFDRILSNLITNAFRYGEPPVIVTAEQSDNHLRIAVEDRGRGVAPEFVPDLFERFSRSDSSRSISGGTGLGLAIARSYAVAHAGDLRYEPADPHGARFQLVLPNGAAA